MGQARIRRKEIEELKRHGRLIDTPVYDRPPIYRVGQDMWITDNAEFNAVTSSIFADMDQPPSVVQRRLAAQALSAERSGTPPDVCQEWFKTQCNAWADAKLKTPMAKPIVLASSNK